MSLSSSSITRKVVQIGCYSLWLHRDSPSLTHMCHRKNFKSLRDVYLIRTQPKSSSPWLFCRRQSPTNDNAVEHRLTLSQCARDLVPWPSSPQNFFRSMLWLAWPHFCVASSTEIAAECIQKCTRAKIGGLSSQEVCKWALPNADTFTPVS